MLGKVKFQNQYNPEFIQVLRQRINTYFETNNIPMTGDYRMVMKTIAMMCIYLVPFAVILMNIVPGWSMLLLCIVMGIGLSGIGMSVMHDANHGAYSSNHLVNVWVGRSIYLLGGSKFTWKMQHNVLHHTYTNIYGMDEDIADKPILRLSPSGKESGIHRYQHLYWFLLYGLATFAWTINKDFKQLFDYNKKGLTQSSGTTPAIELTKLIIAKVSYFIVFLGLPAYFLPYSFGWIFLGFFIMHFVSGLILSSVFQLAHVVEETNHPLPTEAGNIENNWAVHQLQTTADFAHRNRLLSWYVGGLNYQIEHHLFHNICHIHYRKIAPIVKQVAKEFNLPYYEQRTFFSALRSHIRTLKKFGHMHELEL